MTAMDVLVVVVFLFLGYWAVSAFLDRKSAKPPDEPATDRGSEGPSSQGSTNNEPQSQDAEKDSYIRVGWFRILGVSEDASKAEISLAYKKQISQYHPDRVAQMGAEIRQVAEFKSKQINAAYEFAMKLRSE